MAYTNDNTNEAENSAETNDSESADSDVHGEPLTCPRCEEDVVVHYHPQGDYPANYAGFVAHCACSAGPQLDLKAVEGLDPAWYAALVRETETDPESWLEYYLHDNRDVSNWIEDDEGE